jgi:hypothetical protein
LQFIIYQAISQTAKNQHTKDGILATNLRHIGGQFAAYWVAICRILQARWLSPTPSEMVSMDVRCGKRHPETPSPTSTTLPKALKTIRIRLQNRTFPIVKIHDVIFTKQSVRKRHLINMNL